MIGYWGDHQLTGRSGTVASTMVDIAGLRRIGRDFTRRDSKRLLKVNPFDGTFQLYHGLTFMVELTNPDKKAMEKKVSILRSILAKKSVDGLFVFLDSDTYHFTLEGVVERSWPTVHDEEIDYYFDRATRDLPTHELPFTVRFNKFGLFLPEVLCANAYCTKERCAKGISYCNKLRRNLGRKALKAKSFHVSVAYFRERVTKDSMSYKAIKASLAEATKRVFLAQELRCDVRKTSMYHFVDMEHYRQVRPDTRA